MDSREAMATTEDENGSHATWDTAGRGVGEESKVCSEEARRAEASLPQNCTA
eukprot:CAMPEP_0196736172 /NCGR_PEP_ID=MMETSP1091-20130531/14322_1 /TAXON_ID=302021 /ORGANISM="Rhodomonas sp., Strain CCMP768" /LENGTH=51 /DNA_ID=CAMNT_0042079873 /DNA_START=106 /DNA_END=257 /DNA_ORIENTATION=-